MTYKFLNMPGEFWIGASSLSAVAGLIVIFFYTLYTRKMMRLAEETRRSYIKPIFAVPKWQPTYIYPEPHNPFASAEITNDASINIVVRNVGKGPAILMRAWSQPVTESFGLGKTDIFRPTQSTEAGHVDRLDLIEGEICNASFDWFNVASRWLFVVECEDSANGRHQLQILREAGHDSAIEWKMGHAMGDSKGERIVRLTRRFVEIIQAINRELAKLIS